MSVFAVYNSKGGAGKTTSAVNLAWTAALDGQPTLLWDLDPQGAASFFLQDRRGLDQSAKKLLAGKRDWQEEVRSTGIGSLSLIPGDGTLRHWDILLGEQSHGKRLLQDWLKPLRSRFATIVLDCPPGITLLSENLFRAADALLVPVVPSALGFRTLEQIRKFLAQEDRETPPLFPFLSMVDRRRRDHREYEARPPEGFLQASVPLLAEIEKVVQPEAPRAYQRTTRTQQIYRMLWDEIRRRVDSG